MTTLRQILYGLCLLIALALLFWGQHQRLLSERATKLLAHERAERAQERVSSQEAVISELQENIQAERAAQMRLRSQQENIRRALHQREQQIEVLKNENQQLQAWAGVPLPAAARRLRERPTISSAADYQAWLSGSRALQPASDQPPQQQ